MVNRGQQKAFTLLIDARVRKQTRKMPREIFNRVTESIGQLQYNPTPPGCKKLQGRLEGFRIRVGDYRILYTVNWKQKIITIQHVRDRKEGYPTCF
jgi:mRNA interferase RelE/StbE